MIRCTILRRLPTPCMVNSQPTHLIVWTFCHRIMALIIMFNASKLSLIKYAVSMLFPERFCTYFNLRSEFFKKKLVTIFTKSTITTAWQFGHTLRCPSDELGVDPCDINMRSHQLLQSWYPISCLNALKHNGIRNVSHSLKLTSSPTWIYEVCAKFTHELSEIFFVGDLEVILVWDYFKCLWND